MYNKEHVAELKYTYDQRGNVIDYAYLGIDGKPALVSSGIAEIRRKLDARGNVVEYATYGIDGKPILNSTQSAGWRKRYGSLGYQIEQVFFGVDGRPVLSKLGFAASRQRFDARGNLIERMFFGADGKPVMLAGGGYSRILWAYNARDEIIEESYFGVDGKPANNSGSVRITYSYDDVGRQTGVTYWDAQGHPMQVDVTIVRVIPGLSGARSGLIAGDVILTYAGRQVTSIKRFEDLVAEAGANYRIVTVRRATQTLSFSVPSGDLGISLMLVRADTQQAVVPVAPPAN